jgi:hypothetical protein
VTKETIVKANLLLLTVSLGIAGCAPGYTRADVVYAERAEYEYVVPVDRVVVVTQDVLVARGWTVWRVQRAGADRIIWARRGDDEVIRIFATPHGERVALRGLWEARERDDRGRHLGWTRKGPPRDVITDIDVKLRARG